MSGSWSRPADTVWERPRVPLELLGNHSGRAVRLLGAAVLPHLRRMTHGHPSDTEAPEAGPSGLRGAGWLFPLRGCFPWVWSKCIKPERGRAKPWKPRWEVTSCGRPHTRTNSCLVDGEAEGWGLWRDRRRGSRQERGMWNLISWARFRQHAMSLFLFIVFFSSNNFNFLMSVLSSLFHRLTGFNCSAKHTEGTEPNRGLLDARAHLCFLEAPVSLHTEETETVDGSGFGFNW